ncbi:hypothetical protein L7F22_067596 [Adiantum nelumboides]|nr:hypothetical protein [Adiantum nelumboides]
MADRPHDVTEEVSSSQGQQTHEVGESSSPPQTEDEIFRTHLVVAVSIFTQVMQNPRFMALLQPPPPSQSIGNKKQKLEPAKAQPQNSTFAANVRKQRHDKKLVEKPPSLALTVVKGANTPWRRPESHQRAGWGTFRAGTSGYVYKHWKGIIYPNDVSPNKWFSLYTRLFDTVEINNSFYRLPTVNVMDAWRLQAPSGFCYALKFSRFGTHMKRLKDPEGSILPFIDRAARLGQELTGPFLVQLPPNFNLDLDRLKKFLERLPREYRWALEFRDTRWLCNEVYTLLRAHNISLCIHDHKDITCIHPKVLTANWVYIRFHGHDYRRCYSRDQLQDYALWIRSQLERGLDVHAYFNNDADGHAPYNALELREFVFEQ